VTAGEEVKMKTMHRAQLDRWTGRSARRFVQFALLTALVSAAPRAASASSDHHSDHGTSAPSAAEPPASPSILPNLSSAPNTVEVNITAAPTTVSLGPSARTPVYAFNGQVPGPTLEVREGDRVIVHFKNDLPEETTIHWHGLHIPVEADGNPMDPVPPGGTYDYVFTLQPGSAGTYWYHPHPHHATFHQVAMGLFGGLIVRADDDPLPTALTEQLLILSDHRFKADGTLNVPKAHTTLSGFDLITGREGNVILVNGQLQPTVSIRSGEVQRWRVVNTSAARVFRLSLPGHTFMHVGSDGGLFERPVEMTDIQLSPADRVELLVRGTGAPGSQVVLQSLPYDRYKPDSRPADWKTTLNLLTLQYTAEEPTTPLAIPAVLRPVPALDPSKAVTTRTIRLTADAVGSTINDRPFSMDRVDIRAKLNTTEIWRITNTLPADHPFHLHGFSFQVLDSSGAPIPRWEDTVNVRKNSTVQLVVEFRDYPGKRMFHCHMLAHEDAGMMAILEVE
jgi:FtsP/CotA-like multicopper oxidase with cupredoxin domain